MTDTRDTSTLEAFTQDYRTIMLRFLPRRDEAARSAGYEQGRDAFAAGVSLLDVCRIHHELVVEVLHDTQPEDHLAVIETVSELLLEVLAAYDMTHRGVLDP
ncbi:phosphatase RsbU N-terminal domain-containing protein [Terrabacter sp. MAHUQ-38]|uniref:phosphatase RsbU N-terminal domain-containing protein n=1 Tax=unclassified Terrabacter TaxID=2630222 RepID=UPI00165D9FD9|nr:phosphatase RsbU N-terminal domain-containing protein [Terrabacter sp. MAHUQ-38]MBC9819773.1 hypothetical protein [Terrabacter sp. MAHUQ-38]